MESIPCLGLNFLSECSEGHLTEHFLFNLETAISGLAIVVAIYALVLERRFRALMELKRNERKLIIKFVVAIILLTLIGSVLPYVPDKPLPLLGYPIFWELLATCFLLYTAYLAYNLFQHIKNLSKKHISALADYAPKSTAKYQGTLNFILVEAEYFWSDFLNKSTTNNLLQNVLTVDFSQPDFLKAASRSRTILIDTVKFVEESDENTNKESIEIFLQDLIFTGITQNDSIISDDLDSSYKPIMRYIIRKAELTDVLLGNSSDLFLLRMNNKNNLIKIVNRFNEIFHMYLGRQYYHNEDVSKCFEKIDPKILKKLLEFFKDSVSDLDEKAQSDFLRNLTRGFIALENLPEEKSVVLAEGIYNILEEYVQWKNFSKNLTNDRMLFYELYRQYGKCNKYAKQAFNTKLLEKIIGSEDKKKMEYSWYNLKGYYPMMIPAYFFIHGHTLFSDDGINIPKEDMNFHLKILKKMQQNLPKIASGRTQEYLDRVEMPKDLRGANIVKRRAEKTLSEMFPPSVMYDKEENSITYFFSNEEYHKTVLLDETARVNELVFKN
ncbi:hypothetical protein BK004_02715 [bacterium CG10_46_32]|nr:MAG: hypothetical protein BK004_02715 [bacterium CG10_46_32]PIR56059.1 MAG: hypothetical protein COU73_02745 [Parcubacteria group bacterium CG10_big_fil_rev_8_21_14_0_10_46_32]